VIVEVSIGEETPRRYRLHRDGERIVVDHLEGTNAGKGTNHVERKTLIDWHRPQSGIYSLLIGKASYEVFIGEAPDHLTVHLKNRTYRVQAADIRRHRTVTDAPGPVDGLVRITAPIPGRVSRILVQPGQQIGRGDGIVVVEAMKMENELRSPGDGVVVTIAVKEGQAVEGGALLATIE
jgi:biotin carboxyl carrier protein|tara:strand:+ start:431 stop:967 length:537 start_codon:yes stop_codon:yes gene_type:complete